MEIVSQLTDDQIALIGCGVALLATGTMMFLSVYLGRARRTDGALRTPLNNATPKQTSERRAA